MMKSKIIRRLFGTILLTVFCSIFAVSSQEKQQEVTASNEEQTMLEPSQQERLLLQEEKIRYRELQNQRKREAKLKLKEEKRKEAMAKKYAVGFHEVLLLESGIGFDFSARLTPKQWIQIMPTVYLFPRLTSSYTYIIDNEYYYYDYYYNDDDYYNYYDDFYRNKYEIKTFYGAGVDINYKHYLNTKKFFYLLFGVNYSYFHADYEYYDYISFNENDLNFYKYDKASDSNNFNNLKAFTGFGFHSSMHRKIFVGGYLGLGYQYSFYDEAKASLGKNVFDPGYRGVCPVFNFSVGWAW